MLLNTFRWWYQIRGYRFNSHSPDTKPEKKAPSGHRSEATLHNVFSPSHAKTVAAGQQVVRPLIWSKKVPRGNWCGVNGVWYIRRKSVITGQGVCTKRVSLCVLFREWLPWQLADREGEPSMWKESSCDSSPWRWRFCHLQPLCCVEDWNREEEDMGEYTGVSWASMHLLTLDT